MQKIIGQPLKIVSMFCISTENPLLSVPLNIVCIASYVTLGLLHMCQILHWVLYKEGPPKKLELSSGGWGPYSTGFPRYGSVLGTQLYQCTSWWCCERLRFASVNFLLKRQRARPFHDGWFTSAPAHTMLSWVFSSFWPKTAWEPLPHPPYSPDLTPNNFIVSPMWKR